MTLMTLQIIQILVDVLLFAVLLVLFRSIRTGEKRQVLFPRVDVTELKSLMDESQAFASEFMAKLDEGKRELHIIAASLDEKEKCLRQLVEMAHKILNQPSNMESRETERERYSRALELTEKGHELAAISKELNLTAGEIELIKNIIQFRNSPKE